MPLLRVRPVKAKVLSLAWVLVTQYGDARVLQMILMRCVRCLLVLVQYYCLNCLAAARAAQQRSGFSRLSRPPKAKPNGGLLTSMAIK